MKKMLFLGILNFSLIGFAQVPILNLKNKIDSELKLPKNLKENELCIVYKTTGGSFAYDYVNYYFLNKNGNFIVYKEEVPKSYLKNKDLKRTIKEIEINDESKERIMKLVNSTQLNDLLKYSQEDFKIKNPKIKNAPPPPMISDSIGFKITFILYNRQNTCGY